MYKNSNQIKYNLSSFLNTVPCAVSGIAVLAPPGMCGAASISTSALELRFECCTKAVSRQQVCLDLQINTLILSVHTTVPTLLPRRASATVIFTRHATLYRKDVQIT